MKTVLIIVCLAIGLVLLGVPRCMGNKDAETAGKVETVANNDNCDKELGKKERKQVMENALALHDHDEEVTVNVGDAVKYSHSVHASVGSDFNMVYDEEAFYFDFSTKYDDPESMKRNECGGDRAMKTYVLTALKPGDYAVKVIHDFRGEIEKEITYQIHVR